jgi:Bacterial Ig-like domain (group 3)
VTEISAGTAATTTVVGPFQGFAVAGQATMLSATVTGASSASGTPSGSVTFFANGASLGSGILDGGGKTTLTTSALAAGPDSIVAQYAGDSNFAASNSAPMSSVVAGFAPVPGSLSVTAGQSLVIPLTVFAPSGSGMSFTITCVGLPLNSSCAVDTNPVSPSATGTVVKLTFATMAGSSAPPIQPRPTSPVSRNIEIAALLAALLAVGALAWRRAPRWRIASGVCLATLTVALVLGGCGAYTSNGSGSGSNGTPKGAASFTVTGTSGSTTISTVVKVTVQ